MQKVHPCSESVRCVDCTPSRDCISSSTSSCRWGKRESTPRTLRRLSEHAGDDCIVYGGGLARLDFKTKQRPDSFSESGQPDFPWRSQLLHIAPAVALLPSRRLRYSHF